MESNQSNVNNSRARGLGRARGYGRGRVYARGRGRGRSGATYNPTRDHPPVEIPSERKLLDNLALPDLKTMQKPTLVRPAEIAINEVKYLGSYNWTDSDIPSIIVPGCPREWLHKEPPFTVLPDTGYRYNDQNEFRMPGLSFVPLIKAVQAVEEMSKVEPRFEWSSVDVLADQAVLDKLLQWSSSSPRKDFRIDLQLGGKGTVLMNRWESSNREEMEGWTFRHNFAAHSTQRAPGLEHTTAHHRVITYNIGGLQLVVRNGIDAYVPKFGKGSSRKMDKPEVSSDGISSLVESLQGMGLARTPVDLNASETFDFTYSNDGVTLRVIKGGLFVAQSDLAEFTARSVKSASNVQWNVIYLKHFVAQIPYHFAAFHGQGHFKFLQPRRLALPESLAADREAQANLRKLRQTLQIVKDVVVESGPLGRLTLVCQGGVLKLYNRLGKESCLPDDVMELFE